MKNKILVFGIAFVAVALFICVLLVFNETPKEIKDEKISVTVMVIANENEKEYNISTSHKYLGDALEEEKIISGEEGQYGLFIKEAGGIVADESKEQWWCITKEGESVMEGVSSIEISNGDKYELTLKEGYNLE